MKECRVDYYSLYIDRTIYFLTYGVPSPSTALHHRTTRSITGEHTSSHYTTPHHTTPRPITGHHTPSHYTTPTLTTTIQTHLQFPLRNNIKVTLAPPAMESPTRPQRLEINHCDQTTPSISSK